MLRAIHIRHFGMFTDRSFALAPVTVFAGSNQSGKSTLFDAIRIHSFKPERRGKANQQLYARYGEETDVRLDWGGEPPEMSDPEFMNLFAVSAGHVQVDLGGDWLNGVKRSLFAGGIDPRNLIDAFEQLSSDKGTFAHMRQRARVIKEQGELEQRLEALQARRDEILGGLDRQESARTELKALAARLGALKGEEAELAEEVAWQERIAERARCEATLALLGEVADLERAQQERRAFAQDRTVELDALEQRARESEAARIRAEQARQGAALHLAQALAERDRLDKELAARRTWREAVQALEARLAAQRDGQLTRGLLRGALAAFLVVLGAAGVVSFGRHPWAWAGLGAAVAGALALFTALPWLEGWRLLRELKDAWRSRLGGTHVYGRAQLVTEAATLAGLGDGLAQVSAELGSLESEHARRDEEAQAAEAQDVSAAQALAGAQGAEESAAAALRDWLAGMGVASRDQYIDQLGEWRRAQRRLVDAYERLQRVQAERGAADPATLRSEAQAALQRLEAEHVPAGGLPEPELKAKRERLGALRHELEQGGRQRHELELHSHGQAERLMGRLGSLPDEMAALYEELRRRAQQIAALDFDRSAAARALELFRGVAADETTVLAELSSSVAGVFARISGVEEARQAAVALAGLRHEDIRALDRSGVSRPVEHLSSGAQHLLYLALRLEMARRERQGRFALLCLDEPFAFLDPERQLETLQYLREFLEETAWQLVLFTNEPAQAERVRAVFADCQVHKLG
jgi:recombinational DNA repair ATPase RecF